MSAQPQRQYLSRSDFVRGSNDHIVDRAVELRFVSRVPLLCECSDERCRQVVLLTVDGYREARREGEYLTAPDHTVDGAVALARGPDHWVHGRARG